MQGVFISRPFSYAAVSLGVVRDQGGPVQMKPASQRRPGLDAFAVDLRPKSGGWPLPRDVQAKMEAALGAPLHLRGVRICILRPANIIHARPMDSFCSAMS